MVGGAPIHFNVPAMVIQSIAAPVLDIPTPLSIIGGLFGGGKHHPGKYSFRYIWDGIKIGKDGVASVKPVIVAMIYRQRLWRAGKRVTENPVPFECFTYMIAKRLGDIINTKIPPEKRMPLKLAFQKLNPKFHIVTWAAHLEALRQQGPANAAFDALKYAPAVLNTYGNCVRQMLGVRDMYDFLINHVGWDYLYPFSPVMRPKWHSYWFKKADWEDYGEWLLDNLKYRNPAGVRNWMARTGIHTADLIHIEKPRVVRHIERPRVIEVKPPKKPVAIHEVRHVSKPKPPVQAPKAPVRAPKPPVRVYKTKPSVVHIYKPKQLPQKQPQEQVYKKVAEKLHERKATSIADFLKSFGTSTAYAASIEEFSKAKMHEYVQEGKPLHKKESILSKINIDDILLLSAIAIPAIMLLKGRD